VNALCVASRHAPPRTFRFAPLWEASPSACGAVAPRRFPRPRDRRINPFPPSGASWTLPAIRTLPEGRGDCTGASPAQTPLQASGGIRRERGLKPWTLRPRKRRRKVRPNLPPSPVGLRRTGAPPPPARRRPLRAWKVRVSI